MVIKVKYFQAVRSALGVEEESFSLSEGASVKGAMAAATGRHPELHDWGRSLMFAVNEEWADGDTRLYEGDVLAVMPPVSGG